MNTFLGKLVLIIILIIVITAGIWATVEIGTVGVFGLDDQTPQKGTSEVIKGQKMDPTEVMLPNL